MRTKLKPGDYQAYLDVEKDSIGVVLMPADAKSYPANRAPLDGVRITMDREFDEGAAWSLVRQITDRMRFAATAEKGGTAREALCEHLSYAWGVVNDLVMQCDEWTLSKETVETMIRGVIDRLRRIGKCVGFDCDAFRKEGE